MFCSKCGKQISDDARFCERCGNRIHSNNNSGNNNRKTPSQELLKKTFDLERYNRKEGLAQINTWLAHQPIKIKKSFFKTFINREVLGFFKEAVMLKINYAELSYYTCNTNRRYMVDTVVATKTTKWTGQVKNSAMEMLDIAQKESEAQHPNAKIEYTFDRQIMYRDPVFYDPDFPHQLYQTRVILYSYPVD